MAGLEFRGAGFFVPDVPATVRFYEAAFGLKLRYMHASSGYAELETGATLLSFVSEDFLKEAALLGELRAQPSRPDADPIGSQIALVTRDMAVDWQRALAAGATIIKQPEAKPWGQTAGYVRDLNGVVVELCTPSPRD
jgi:catechol 2,3-dioxygenase-like lactoylglutathione lyase family enzyme